MNLKAVSGTISAVAASSITVASSGGASSVVHIDASTRITRIVNATVADLSTGTRIQVITDTNVTSAQRIVITPAGQSPAGGGFGAGAATPRSGINPACFRRQGQAQGQTTTRQGLRGTVDSASSMQVVLDTAAGQTFTVPITSATIIQSSATGQQSDLIAGAMVLAAGASTSDGITARTITVQPAGTP